MTENGKVELTLEDLIGFVGEDARPGLEWNKTPFLEIPREMFFRLFPGGLASPRWQAMDRYNGFSLGYGGWSEEPVVLYSGVDRSDTIRTFTPGDPMPWRDQDISKTETVEESDQADSIDGEAWEKSTSPVIYQRLYLDQETIERCIDAATRVTWDDGFVEVQPPPKYEYWLHAVIDWPGGRRFEGEYPPMDQGWENHSTKTFDGMNKEARQQVNLITRGVARNTLGSESHIAMMEGGWKRCMAVIYRREIPAPAPLVYEYCPSLIPLRGIWKGRQ
jgi:hypothetical protein